MLRRDAAAVAFGLVYGGCFVNGVHKGFGYALGLDEGILPGSRMLALGVEIFSVVGMAFLAGYVGRHIVPGVISAAVGSGLILAMPVLIAGMDDLSIVRQVAAVLAFGLGLPGTILGSRFPAEHDDVSRGRVIGVAWWHWLWLWLPWQYMIANVVWLATPRFLSSGTGGWLFGDVVRSAIAALVACVAGFKAVQALRADAVLSRTQAFARFLSWFLVVPILANLWRRLF